MERNSISLSTLDHLDVKKGKLHQSEKDVSVSIHNLKEDEMTAPTLAIRAAHAIADHKSELVEVSEQIGKRKDDIRSVRNEATRAESQLNLDIELVRNNLAVLSKKNVSISGSISESAKSISAHVTKVSELKLAIQELQLAQNALRSELEGTISERAEFIAVRAEYQQRLRHAESVHDSNKAVLAGKEKELDALASGKRDQDKRLRELRDKEYSLLDSIRQSQVEVRKMESELSHLTKKVISSSKIVESADKRLEAIVSKMEAGRIELSQLRGEKLRSEQAVFRFTDQLGKILLAFKKREAELHDLDAKIPTVSAAHDQLKAKSESTDYDKNQMAVEVSQAEDALAGMTAIADRSCFELKNEELERASLQEALDSLTAECNRIKRVNLNLTKTPVLIQSNEHSNLLDRLQINPFLKYSQSQLQPIPLLVDKISEVLALLQATQDKADLALAEMSKANAVISAMRQMSMQLVDDQQTLTAFKQDSVRAFVANILNDGRKMLTLPLDSLQVTDKELTEALNVIRATESTAKVSRILLATNRVGDSALTILMQIIFELPYLSYIGLRRNFLSGSTIQSLVNQLRSMDGITSVAATANDVQTGLVSQSGLIIEARSGKLVRIAIDVTEQASPDELREMLRERVPEQPVQVTSDSLIVPTITRSSSIRTSVKVMTTPERPPSDRAPLQPRSLALPTRLSITDAEKQSPYALIKVPTVVKPTSRVSASSDASFQRHLDISKRRIVDKAIRLGIKSVPPPNRISN